MVEKETERVFMDEEIYGTCAICGNVSAYDDGTIKSSTHLLNGVRVLMCTNCEDDFMSLISKVKRGKKDGK